MRKIRLIYPFLSVRSDSARKVDMSTRFNELNQPLGHCMLGVHVWDVLIDSAFTVVALPPLPIQNDADMLSVHWEVSVENTLPTVFNQARSVATLSWASLTECEEHILRRIFHSSFNLQQGQV